ncbi:MAG TPA: hypothetical protein VGQ76_22400 [Thermoanaerobaculia bacterium]|jgi:hypothetical protein|nr:hypothetical protein [Thermoanaerobaculia bacterium]
MDPTNDDLQQLLGKWTSAIQNYQASLRHDEDRIIRTPPDDSATVAALGETLREIFLTMVAGGSYRDIWLRRPGISWVAFGHSIAFKAKKLDQEYEFGYDARGFF